jgi:hypothetical protein
MKKLKAIAFALTLTLSLFSSVTVNAAQGVKPKIQIAILLDSSNSMDGLIDQTRYQLWEIVNSLTKVTKNGVKPELEIALYHYGNDSLPSSEGYVRLLNDFTSELDLVSENLFAIQTNGGQEYAGWVITSAMNQLEWSDSDEDFKAIFIAGNEPFDQGSVNWQEAVNMAKRDQILVNTIYCGGEESLERDLWARGAQIGGGSHVIIDQNQQVAFVESPYDEEIALLNEELNHTYIPYGSEGEIGLTRQATEDNNAALQGAGASRGISKVSAYYNNASWDLVDAINQETVNLEELETDELPSEMQNMTTAEQRAYLEGKQAEREDIQTQISNLSQQRDEYLEQQRQTQHNESNDTLNFVMIRTLENQLKDQGFSLNE